VDVRAVKLALPIEVPWQTAEGLRHLSLYPLSDAAVDAAGVTEDQVAAGLSEYRAVVEIVAASLRVDPRKLGASVTPVALRCLYQWWLVVQRRAWPSPEDLSRWVRKGVIDHPGAMSDAVLAMQADDASTFYGSAAIDLTRGQVSYFVSLRSAWQEWYGGDKVKTPTDDFLDEDREARLQWQMIERSTD